MIADHHAALLAQRAIPIEVATAAGVRSVLSESDLPEGCPPYWTVANGYLPGLLFPWTDAEGRVEYQIRPDEANRPTDSTGRQIKYATRSRADGYTPMLWVAKRGTDKGARLLVEGTCQTLAASAYAPDDAWVLGMVGCRGWMVDGTPIVDLSLVEGAEVVVCLDADMWSNPDVWDAGETLQRALVAEGAAAVRYLRLPAGKKAGLDDVLGSRPPTRRAEYLARLLESAEREKFAASRRPKVRSVEYAHTQGIQTDRPVVTVNDDRLRVIQALTACMVSKWDGHRLFNHGGAISSVVGDTLKPLEKGDLLNVIQESAVTISVTQTQSGGQSVTYVWPDSPTVQALAAKADEFSPVEGVRTVPFVRSDGTLCVTSGYDPVSKMMVKLPDELENLTVPEEPTPEQARAAARFLLDEWLGDFPFPTAADRANMLALVLTPFIRTWVPLVPVAVVNGLQMGVGKNMLASLFATVVFGTPPEPLPYTTDDEEMRKLITAEFRRGSPLLVFDEAHRLEGASFARAVTSLTYTDRILGVSQTASFPNRVTWMALGNNVEISGDMARRVYEIALRTDHPNPENRPESAFRHREPEWTHAHRAELVTAILTMIRGWVVAGKPVTSASFGSFEAWERTVGGILSVAGVPGFLDNLHTFRSESDHALGHWQAHIQWLRQVFGARQFTVADVVKALTSASLTGATAEPPPGLEDVRDPRYGRALGRAYARQRDRWHGEVRLVRDGLAHGNVAAWRVEVWGGSSGGIDTRHVPTPEPTPDPVPDADPEVSPEAPEDVPTPAPEPVSVPPTEVDLGGDRGGLTPQSPQNRGVNPQNRGDVGGSRGDHGGIGGFNPPVPPGERVESDTLADPSDGEECPVMGEMHPTKPPKRVDLGGDGGIGGFTPTRVREKKENSKFSFFSYETGCGVPPGPPIPPTIVWRVTRDGEITDSNPDEALTELVTIAQRAGGLGVDVETTGFPVGHAHYRLKTVQLGDEHIAYVFDVRDPDPNTRAVIAGLLAAAPRLWAHSATADLVPLVYDGYADESVWDRMYDTVIPAKLADPASTGSDPGLKQLAGVVLGESAVSPQADAERATLFKANRWRTNTDADTPPERSGWAQVDPADPVMLRYAASDVLDVAALPSRLPEVSPAVLERERAVQRVTARVAHRGLKLDRDRVRSLLDEHTAARQQALDRVRASGVDNPGSSRQIADALTAAGVELPRTKPSNAHPYGQPSVTAAVLTKLAQQGLSGRAGELVASVLAFREHDKLINSFLMPYWQLCERGDGRVRPTIYTLAADTGRMSCVRPNLQQVPRHGGIRPCITADPGYVLVSADFSGVELRVAAALSGDTNLRRMLDEGVDLHAEIAREVFGPGATKEDRTVAKRVVFGRLYGGGVATLAAQVGVPEHVVASAVDVLDDMTPGLSAWSRAIRDAVKAGATEFPTYAGRTIYLPREYPHKAPNYAIQGTARELLVDALLRWDATKWGGGVVLPVHDEIIAMVPEHEGTAATAALLECMTTELAGVVIEAEASEPSPVWSEE